ncbi:hypothetical protein AALO_G00126840, partial [Alosa alosa]
MCACTRLCLCVCVCVRCCYIWCSQLVCLPAYVCLCMCMHAYICLLCEYVSYSKHCMMITVNVCVSVCICLCTCVHMEWVNMTPGGKHTEKIGHPRPYGSQDIHRKLCLPYPPFGGSSTWGRLQIKTKNDGSMLSMWGYMPTK